MTATAHRVPVSGTEYRRNAILASVPDTDLSQLLEHATFVTLPAGHTLQSPGEPYATVFFPTSGVVSGVSSLASGQHVEIATVGSDGVVGVGTVLSLHSVQLWFIVHMGARGYQVPTETFARLFAESEPLRALTLAHVGRLFTEIVRSAVCNRFHSHRERLARWLVITMRKAGVPSLPLTHEYIAQMVGGPRHAVTAALADLRGRGAIDYQRGLIVIVDERMLLQAACECVVTAHSSQS